MTLFQILNTRPVAFNPEYSRICGKEVKLNNGKTVFKCDQSCAILLSQLCYWHSAMKGKEFYKSDEELMAECGCFSRDKHLKNKKRLIEMGVISYNVKGTPAKGYWQVEEKQLISLLSPASSVVVEQPQQEVVPLQQHIYTENTTDIYIEKILTDKVKEVKKDKILKQYKKETTTLYETLSSLKEKKIIENEVVGDSKTPHTVPASPLPEDLEDIFCLYIRWFFTAKEAKTRKPSTFIHNISNKHTGGLKGCLESASTKEVISMLVDAIDRSWQGIKSEYVLSYIKKGKVHLGQGVRDQSRVVSAPRVDIVVGDVSSLY